MPALDVILDLTDPANTDPARGPLNRAIAEGKLIHVDAFTLGAIPHGMKSGKPSVAFAIPLEDGRAVFAESSLALFLTAADAFKARYGDPRDPAWKPGPKSGH